MNRFEEFLEDLDTKNKIFLYLSIVIIGIIIYYNVNLSYLSGKINKNERIIVKLQKKNKINLKNYHKQIVKLKRTFKNLSLTLNEDFKDLKYLNERLNLSVLKINDNKFYSLLENILFQSSNFNLSPNFVINSQINDFKSYHIEINGSLPYCGENNLFNFIKFLESQKVVNNIDKFYFDKNSSDFYIRYNIWGIK